MLIKREQLFPIPIYRILHSSNEWNSKWKKPFIVVSRKYKSISNVDRIEDIKLGLQDISCIFINHPKEKIEIQIPSLYFYERIDDRDPPKLFPMDLNNLFIDSTKSDIALNITPIQRAILEDPRYIHEVNILDKTKRLMGVDFKKSFKEIITNEFTRNSPTNTEEFIEQYLREIPSLRIPSVISDDMFSKEFKPKLKYMRIGYCFRCKDVRREISIISEMERQLLPPRWITIYENYFGIVERIKSIAKKSKVKVISNECIKIRSDYLDSLGLDYSIGDYIC